MPAIRMTLLAAVAAVVTAQVSEKLASLTGADPCDSDPNCPSPTLVDPCDDDPDCGGVARI